MVKTYDYNGAAVNRLYLLEIRIARELLGEDRRDIVPPALLDYFCSKSVKKAMRYPQVMPAQDLPSPDHPLYEAEMLRVLYRLIGHGETGLFTELIRHREEIKQTICLCMERLRDF